MVSDCFPVCFTISTLIRNDTARIVAVFLVAVVLDTARIVQWDRKPERKLQISIFQLEGIIVVICKLVS